ncbi:N-acetylglucosamine-6-phosphate deacetylase [Paenibacillus guangzhouensis]|uniref:N-acetylglucosamine-6-phosphate deacetylase n=1 Tax=Paenibacillus guangzhouensis TaxID=1473112 RepID=UPI00126738BA|nr:N-acetylglucosamine-6-phosphate deacetylase [Paenibacillus guangzhouensis]
MSTSNPFFIVNANVVTPQGIIENGCVRIENGTIVFVGTQAEVPVADLATWQHEALDAQGGWIVPGFIDVHVHGGFGADFMDSNKEVLDTITKFHLSQGTTTIMATTMTQSHDAIERVLAEVHEYKKNPMPYAQVHGVHMEGPFINPKYKGAQNPEFMVEARVDWLEDWNTKYPGVIKQISLAAERNGALEAIRWARANGINVAAAHTDATYDEMMTAVEAGLNQAVHTYNAMTPLTHRAPGTVGAVLSEDRIVAELIADGIHVHPAAMKVLVKCKTNNNLVVITDAMSAAGLGDGDYDLGGLAVVAKNGEARLKDGGSLAGSLLTMIVAFQNMVRMVGVSIEQAVQLTSYNAAKQLGIDDRTGSIRAGLQADLLLLDKDLNIQSIWVQGNKA